MTNHQHEDKTTFDVSVVGLGPGGLVAMLYAAANGQSVIGLGNRSDYVRGQRVALEPGIVHFLKTYLDDADPLDQVFARDLQTRTVQTKDLERFLYRKVTQYPNAKLIILGQDERSELVCDQDQHHLVIHTKQGEQIYAFHHLLAADGVRHHTADEVARVFNKQITYVKSPYQARHAHHAAVQLKLKEGSTSLVERPAPHVQVQQQIKLGLQRLKYGWNTKEINDMPKCYVVSNAARTKFSFAGEIPSDIYHQTDRALQAEQLKQWAALEISREYGISEDQLEFKISKKHGESHEKLKATTFEIAISVCKEPVICLHDHEQQGVFAQVGDARRVPYYRLGHGTNDAMNCALAFIRCIDREHHSFDTHAYASFVRKIDNHLDGSMQEEVERAERNLKSARVKLGKAIKELLPLLKDAHIDTAMFQSVKEGGFSLSNLIAVMHDVEERINTFKNSPEHEHDGAWDMLGEKIEQVKERIFYYTSSTADSVQYIAEADENMAPEENVVASSRSM